MAFRGRFDHQLDDRGRVAVPAKYRTEFPNNLAVITPSPEGCLRLYPEAAFEEMSNRYASTPATTVEGRRARRSFDGVAHDTELDRQGRILIPARLREQAGLNGTVVVSGNRECLEIWNPEAYEREMEEAEIAASAAGQRPEE
jgi:transcriptional regulator MraZ